MDVPLGRTIGNALEVRESIDILKGQGPEDTTELTLALGAEMLVLGGKADHVEQARERLLEARESGAALDVFRRSIEAQADPQVIDRPADRLERTRVVAQRSGVVGDMDAMGLGLAAMALGAGR